MRTFTGNRWLGGILAAAMLLLSPLGGAAGERGLLWRIEKEGIPPSYLFGTIHSDDPRVNRLPEPVRRALDGAKSFTMEVLLDEAALAQLMVLSVLPPGQSLADLLGETLYRKTVEAMARHGYPEAAVERLKPWVVLTTLSTPRPQGGEILDLALFTRADSMGKPVYGLESVAEQVTILDRLPMEEQIAALRDTLAHIEELESIFDKLYRAYLDRDLDRLVALSDEHLYMGSREAGETLMEQLVDVRNRRMAERMQPRLEEGGAFVAVGALHLPGEQGLIQLLRERGWKVTAVY
ncbi:MAG: TraB/GumN family protein [Gammaproteobacteria bacterium]